MAYFCKACSYRGNKSGQLGECPACGSFDIIKHTTFSREQPPQPLWRLVLVIVLWVVLIAMIVWKLVF